MRRPIIGVVGAASASPSQRRDARRLGRLIAESGWILLTGGRDAGIMAQATAGAKEVPGSLAVGILPDRTAEGAAAVDVAIVTGMGDARNAINVLSSRAVVACGVEGAGTASEVALAIKSGVPVLLMNAAPDAVSLYQRLGRDLVRAASSPAEAIALLTGPLGIAPGPPWLT